MENRLQLAPVLLNQPLGVYHQKEMLDQVYILEKDSEILIFKEKYQDEGKNIFICNENTCVSKIGTIKEALKVKI